VEERGLGMRRKEGGRGSGGEADHLSPKSMQVMYIIQRQPLLNHNQKKNTIKQK
jgi:hypothetical protein